MQLEPASCGESRLKYDHENWLDECEEFFNFKFQRWCKHNRVSRVYAASPVEIQEPSAGFFHHHFERREIPSRGLGLNPDFGLAGGNHHGVLRASQATNGPASWGQIQDALL